MAAQPPATTGNCLDLKSCKIENADDVLAYASLAWKANLTCVDALTKSNNHLDDADEDSIRKYYLSRDRQADCYPPMSLQRGWIATALLNGRGHSSIWRHGFQLLPSFSLGVPVAFLSSKNDAELALSGLNAVGGAFIRYSPIGFWGSVHGFVGTSTVAAGKLDAATYPAPAMLLYGGGIDVLGGSLSLSVLGASLRPDGLFSRSLATSAILQFGVDLTSIGVTVAGLTK